MLLDLIDVCIKLLAAYCVGSIMGSLVLGHWFDLEDVRGQGSGNAGATNALRVHGPLIAVPVLLIDVGKGVIAATLIPWLPLLSPEPFGDWLYFACGFAAVMGHLFPLFFDFNGGKGAATLAGIYAVLYTAPFMLGLIMFAAVVVASGYVSLGNVVAAWVIWLTTALMSDGFLGGSASLFSLGMFFVVLLTHRQNLERIIYREEPRMDWAVVMRRLPFRRRLTGHTEVSDD